MEKYQVKVPRVILESGNFVMNRQLYGRIEEEFVYIEIELDDKKLNEYLDDEKSMKEKCICDPNNFEPIEDFVIKYFDIHPVPKYYATPVNDPDAILKNIESGSIPIIGY